IPAAVGHHPTAGAEIVARQRVARDRPAADDAAPSAELILTALTAFERTAAAVADSSALGPELLASRRHTTGRTAVGIGHRRVAARSVPPRVTTGRPFRGVAAAVTARRDQLVVVEVVVPDDDAARRGTGRDHGQRGRREGAH